MLPIHDICALSAQKDQQSVTDSDSEPNIRLIASVCYVKPDWLLSELNCGIDYLLICEIVN